MSALKVIKLNKNEPPPDEGFPSFTIPPGGTPPGASSPIDCLAPSAGAEVELALT